MGLQPAARGSLILLSNDNTRHLVLIYNSDYNPREMLLVTQVDNYSLYKAGQSLYDPREILRVRIPNYHTLYNLAKKH
jgi:hypothetical protein